MIKTTKINNELSVSWNNKTMKWFIIRRFPDGRIRRVQVSGEELHRIMLVGMGQ